MTTSDLVNCRQVNRKWNEISSHIMRQRADIQIAFKFLGSKLSQSIQYRPEQTLLKDCMPLVNALGSRDFSDLVECLKVSKNFPCTSFRFKDVVKSDDMEIFLSIWGQNIFALGVKIKEADDVQMLRVFLEKAPNLKKLHIDFGSIDLYYKQTSETAAVHLFVDSNNEFQLPKLNTLRVAGSCDYFAGIIADILKVASNLNCFEKSSLDGDDDSECITAKDLAMLQSRNKLHCLKDVNLLFKRELIDLLENSPQITDLQLKSLELSITWIWDDDELSARATKIINKIFDSSKNSLLNLTIPPLGLLSELVIPKFENLRKMCLSHDESYEDYYPGPSMFPPLFEMADHFPNLQELSKSEDLLKIDKNK